MSSEDGDKPPEEGMAGADGPDGEQVIEEAGQGSGDDAMDDLEADGEREEVNGEAGAEEEAAESGGQGERQGEQQEGEGMQVEGVGEADSKKVEDVKQDTKDTTKGEDGTGPPETDDFLSMPPHGTEVFVGGLAKSTTDAEIQEFCEQCGEVFSLRVPKDPGIPGQNRGYAFVTFKTTEQAATATEKLNQKELDAHPGKKVRVILSQVKNRLFIGNVPKDLKYEDLKKVLDGEVKGATQIELLMDREGNFNRGFAFVEFYNHAAADLARKILSRPDFRLKDRILTVTWAELRKNDGDQEKVKSIYIGNLPHTVTEEKLKDMFKAYGEVERIVLPLGTDGHKYREYGFVHYTDRAWALKAIEAAGQERPVLDGRELSVALAKPPVVSEPRAPGLDSRGRVPASAGSRGPGGRNRPLARAGHRGMGGGYPDAFEGYGGYGGYGGGEYGGGGFGGYAAAGGYEMGGVSLVPMYLPNGQVGFVFQQQQQQQQQHLQQQHQQRLGPAAPSSGGPIRKGAGQHSHSGGHRGERGSGDYAGSSYGSYGSYGSQRNQRGPGRPSGGSYGSYGGSSRGSGGSSRYRPY